MGIPREYEQILDDVSGDDHFAHVRAMSDDEVDASMKRTGYTDEMLESSMARQQERMATKMGRTLLERLCWMTRAQRDAWLARSNYEADEHDEVRSIWAQLLEELAAAGKLSPKLRAELDAEPRRPAPPGTTAEGRATELHRRGLPLQPRQ